MEKSYLLNLLKEKNVITKNNKRKFCWKSNFDDKCRQAFNDFKINYRTDEEAWFCLLNDVEPNRCEICGKLAKFTGTKKTLYPGYNTTCENCSANSSVLKLSKYYKTINNRTEEERKEISKKARKTRLEKYGDENYTLFGSKKFKDTLKEKYGDEFYNNREKSKQTCLKRYGVECNLSLDDSSKHSKQIWKENYENIIKKIRKNSLIKYGTESPNQSEEIKKKQKEGIIKKYGSIKQSYTERNKLSLITKLERYGDSTYHNKEKVAKTLENRHLTFEKENNCTKFSSLLKEYGQGWLSLKIPIIYSGRFRYISNEYIPIIKKYSEEFHNLVAESKGEKELYDFIMLNTNNKVYRHKRDLIYDQNKRYELDIYIPKLKIAFEFNGVYWHSTLQKDKYYHQRKSILCYNSGIQLVHIYENNWKNNKEEIKNRIKKLLNGEDCSEYNWVPLKEYHNYKLSEPKKIKIKNGKRNLYVYTEGNFIKNKVIL